MTLLTRSDTGPIARLTLNAPDRLNALSDGMLAALLDTFDQIASEDATRVVILSGAGRAFCAGHDLKEMQGKRQGEDSGAAAFKDLFDRCAIVMQRIQSLPQPVIAQVHGLAAAAGCQLAATCDMVVAAEDARFGVNGVNIGLFCSTPMVALTRAIPRKAAFEMLTTGRFITAAEAKELGLVTQVAAPSDLATQTHALAETIASKLPTAVRYGKQAFYQQAEMSTADAYAFTGEVIVNNMLDADTNEGIQAFLEKRPPDWA